jgi:hypothetical protein
MMDKRSRHRGTVVTLLALLMASVSPSTAAEETVRAAEHSDPVVRELGGIREELRALARLLEGLRGGQEVAALLTRLQLKQQRLSPIESLLRSARSEEEAVEQEIERLSAHERTMLDGVGADGGDEAPSNTARQELAVLREQKTILSNRAEALRSRVVEYENDLASALKDLQALEDAVDEHLGLR